MPNPSFAARGRTVPAGMIALVLLPAFLGACGSEAPPVDEATEAPAESTPDAGRAAELWDEVLTDAEGAVTFIVDGAEMSAEEARSMAIGDAAQVEISKRIEGTDTTTEVRVVTSAGGEFEHEAVDPLADMSDFSGLIVVDGEIQDASVLETLDPEQIAEVRVYKGERSAELYDDPRAIEGVIEITTRGAADGAH
jgi:hypothetical protein